MSILSALAERQHLLDERAGGSPAGYSMEKISYSIVLRPDGTIAGTAILGDVVKNKHRPMLLSVPAKPAGGTSNIAPKLFWDKTAYALGATKLEGGSKRVLAEHAAFKQRQIEAIGETEDEGLKAFLAFLARWNPETYPTLDHAEEMRDTNVVFRLEGERRFLHERPAAHEIVAVVAGAAGGNPGFCLVTGARAPIAQLHSSIKGVRGAQTGGAMIVSFNQASFTSYDKEKGDNAPVSQGAMVAYVKALNALLADPRRHVLIGDATVVFWARIEDAANAETLEAATDVMGWTLGGFGAASAESEEKAVEQDLFSDLGAIAEGRPVKSLGERKVDKDTRFYVLGLSPNAARISIRFWLETTLGALAERLRQHYLDMQLEPAAWKTPPSVYRLVRQLAPLREKAGGRLESDAEHVPAHLAGEVTRAILSGTAYPLSLLTVTLSRIRADHQATPLRIAMIKATLIRQKKDVPVALNRAETNTGYLLGRLFAVLEKLQEAGVGDVNAGIRDRYIGAASATPARVYPVLLRGTQNHVSAALKKKGWQAGRAVNLEREIQDIVHGLPSSSPFPATLELIDQGLFFVGYYHQQADLYAKRGKAPGEEGGPTDAALDAPVGDGAAEGADGATETSDANASGTDTSDD